MAASEAKPASNTDQVRSAGSWRSSTGSPVAVETVGNWYWIVSEIEPAGMVHALRAKMMLASVKKTDKLDARGMNGLQRSGTLPTVSVPPSDLRDRRELFRTRMIFTQQRTRLKNPIHATLTKYGLSIEASDGRRELVVCLEKLPSHTRYATVRVLEQIDSTSVQIEALEERMKEVFEPNREIDLLMGLPGVGFTLAVVIFSEVGDISRFESASHFAFYSGTAPRVQASGGKVRVG
jgi:transposase